MASVLSAHTNSDVVTRQQLAAVETPAATKSHKPVAHIELVRSLESVLDGRGIKIESEKLALRRDGQMFFAVFDLVAYNKFLTPTTGGLTTVDGRAALGLRQANNKTMSIQICAGLRVFVCDNLAFNGDFIALNRKHTSRLTLRDELSVAVDRFEQHYVSLTREIESMKTHNLTDQQAKALLHDVFVKGIMPLRFLADVSKNYFNPPHPEFEPRTIWSLHNAFTETAKQMPVTTRLPATQQLGKLLRGEVLGSVKALPPAPSQAMEGRLADAA